MYVVKNLLKKPSYPHIGKIVYYGHPKEVKVADLGEMDRCFMEASHIQYEGWKPCVYES